MSKVLCGFRECIYNENGVCTKEVIDLDERVEDIFVGCPDAEWKGGNESTYKDEVCKEYEYLHWDIR